MNIEFNKFGQTDIPSIVLCNPNLERLFSFESIMYESSISLKFNALSEFSFNIPKSIDNEKNKLYFYTKTNEVVNAYTLFQAKRLIYIQDIGYFVITNVTEYDEGSSPYITVESQSIESELLNKKMVNFNGSYPIRTATINGVNYIGVLDYIIENYLPNWTIQTELSSSISERFCYFDISDTTMYSFLTTDFEKGYNAVILFNESGFRTIGVKELDNLEYTNIYLSHENLIVSSEFSEISDEIATCLHCYGQGDLDIREVNPLGTSTIYNFSYYKNIDWMSQNLIDKITKWEEKYLSEEENINAFTSSKSKEYYIDSETTGLKSIYLNSSKLEYASERRQEDIKAQEELQSTANSEFLIAYDNRKREIEALHTDPTKPAGDFGNKQINNLIQYLTLGGKHAPSNFVESDYYEWAEFGCLSKIETDTMSSFNSYTQNIEFLRSGTSNEPPQNTKTLDVSIRSTEVYKWTTYGSLEKIENVSKDAPIALAIAKRKAEIANYTKLLNNEQVTLTKSYYQTNINFLYNGIYSDIAPTVTDANSFISEKEIPTDKKIVITNLYKWEDYGGLYSLYSLQENVSEASPIIDIINKNKLIKYSDKWLSYLDASDKQTDLQSILKNMDTLYSAEKEKMKTAVDNGKSAKDNEKDIADYKTNMTFLDFGTKADDVPSTQNINYKLNNDMNKFDKDVLRAARFYDDVDANGKEIIGYGGRTSIGLYIRALKSLMGSLVDNCFKYTNDILSFTNTDNFTNSEYLELQSYMYENTYQNEYIAIYENLDATGVLKQTKELYSASVDVLSRASQPRYEFTITLANFLNIAKYKDNFSKELTLGKKIRIETKDKIISSVLLEINFSYDKPEELELVFSNRLRLDNHNYQYSDLFGQVIQAATTVSSQKANWSSWTNSYQQSFIDYMNTPLDASANGVVNNSTTKEISLDSTGISGRKLLSDTSNYSSNEFWITSNNINFTSDNWKTTKKALGEINVNGTSTYGLVGNNLIGKITANDTLSISNNNESFVLKPDSVEVTNMSLDMMTIPSSESSQQGITIRMTKESGFQIGKVNPDTNEMIKGEVALGVDPSGNLVLGSQMNMGGWKLNEKGFVFTEKINGHNIENFIYPNSVKLGNGNLIIDERGNILMGKYSKQNSTPSKTQIDLNKKKGISFIDIPSTIKTGISIDPEGKVKIMDSDGLNAVVSLSKIKTLTIRGGIVVDVE